MRPLFPALLALSLLVPLTVGAQELSPHPEPTSAITDNEFNFIEHFDFHEPVYFLIGVEKPAIKFQISFKYRLANLGVNRWNLAQFLSVAYSQRSFWDIASESSPFYDNNYMPEIFYEARAHLSAVRWFNWYGVQAGFRHESNGRGGPDSRSMNSLTLRTGVIFGDLGGWHVSLGIAPALFVGDLSDNMTIAEYRGFARYLVSVSQFDGFQLRYAGIFGSGFDRHTMQFDLTFPLRVDAINARTFVLLQYFDGYGESLLRYDRRDQSLRIGLSFIR